MKNFFARFNSVTFPLLIVLSITIWNVIRIYSSINNWSILIKYGANPCYILGSGLIWSLTGIFSLFFLGTRRNHYRILGSMIGIAYFIWYWFDRLVIQITADVSVIYSLIFTLALLGLYLFRLSKSKNAYRHKEHG